MANDPETQGESVDLSVIREPNRQLAAETVSRFRELAIDSGYDVDELRMTFAGMALAALIRDDMSPTDVSKSITAIRDVASLMGVDTKPLNVKKRAEQEADLIIDAINPRIEGLLDAIERGRDASEIKQEGAGSTSTAYAEVQE